jgi:hypothetical protein
MTIASAGLALVGWAVWLALAVIQPVDAASGTETGAQMPESSPPILSPHGDLVFRATHTTSCMDCHRVDRAKGGRLTVLDNAAVKELIAKGKGAHSGRFADCFRCHAGGRKGVEQY